MLNGNEGEVPLKVVVRVRPLIGDEVLRNPDPCLYCVPGTSQIIVGRSRQFQFDHVFDQDSTQEVVYKVCVYPLIEAFYNGYNATVFAYGQTGSGKTYTMGTGSCVYLDDVATGIIPRALNDIFLLKNALQKEAVCKLHVTFIEIYREETTDLLDNSSSQLQIREDEAGNTVIIGAREEPVDNIDEVLTLLDAGTAIRHVGLTNMNEQSSRSHCIFTLILEQYRFGDGDHEQGSSLCSRFHFVDLAGSERAHRTGNQGTRFKESVSINTGLLALGNVISALSDPKRKNGHIPYRESKLTRLLKDSLGGNSSTVMITCLSPALADLDEDINSLKYASRAQKICNKPIINWDREKSKINEMEKEIQALRSQLNRRLSDQSEYYNNNIEFNEAFIKINDLQMDNERHDQKEAVFVKVLHEINAILTTMETSLPGLPIAYLEQIEEWRNEWKRLSFSNRPFSAPSRMSRVNRDIVEMLRNELAMYTERDAQNKQALEYRSNEMDELRQEVIAFGEENAKLRLDLDVAINNATDLQEKMYEQQMAIQHIRRYSHQGSHLRRGNEGFLTVNEKTPFQRRDRVYERFRVKNDLLMSEIDDRNDVEHDEDISSDDDEVEVDDREKEKEELLEQSFQRKRIQSAPVSKLPRPIVRKEVRSANPKTTRKPRMFMPEETNTELLRLESSRESFIMEAKAAESCVRNNKQQMKELEKNIRQKEELITNLVQNEHEAKSTSQFYKDKLGKLEKDYEKSKKELEDAQRKITHFQSEDNTDADSAQRTKLENEYKKKLKVMQKKFDAVKDNETAGLYLTSYQQKNEKRVKDLEGQISRMKNQQSGLGRQLKEESEKKLKYEQEMRKNELRIKELELKTDQQQKLLRRKNEEVVAARRKLRLGGGNDNTKENEELEKRRQWIEGEIEKIVSRQKNIDLLEEELCDLDISLRKREALMKEKEKLEVKRTESSVNISKNIVDISLKMDTLDEQISQHRGEEKSMQQLLRVKDDLMVQKQQMDSLVHTGGLGVHEERRLIELGEALEAVEEAVQFKNDLIARKQLNIAEHDLDHYRNVELLLNNMGDLTKTEYKHLLGKFFMKIIELRKADRQADESRCELEFMVSEQEKKLQDTHHFIAVIESKHERENIALQTKHEQEAQFLMAQLRAGDNSRENSSSLEKKVKQLEKELYFYKVNFRKYKDLLKDSSSSKSTTSPSMEEEVAAGQHIQPQEGVHFPPLNHPGRLVESERFHYMDQQQMEEQKRYQEAFDYNPHHTKKKDSTKKTQLTEDMSIVDSIEVVSRNPWHNI